MSGTISGVRLSPAQERLWQLQASGVLGQAPMVRGRFRLERPVEPAALRLAVERVAVQHEILRSVFLRLPGMGVPLQAARAAPAIGFDGNEPGLDPDGVPLAVRVEGDVLTLAMPAYIADGPTLLRVAAAVVRALDGSAADEAGEALPYFDLAAWQWDLLAEDDSRQAWPADALIARDGVLPSLPALRPVVAGGFLLRRQVCALPNLAGSIGSAGLCEAAGSPEPARLFDLTRPLDGLCERLGVMRTDALAAAWMVLLWRLSGQSPVPVAVIADGRPYPDLLAVPGPLGGPVPLEVRPDAGMSFAAFVQAVAAARGAAEELRHHVPPPAGDTIAPFQFEHLVQDPQEAGGLAVEIIADGEPCLVRLAALTRADGTLSVALDYDGSACQADGIDRMAAQFTTLMGDALGRPDTGLAGLDILGAAERARIAGFQGKRVERPWCPVHRVAAAAAEAAPDRVVLRGDGMALTAGALDQQVRALAERLRRSGVETDRPVALLLPRGVASVIGILAVLRAGGAWLPLPPDLPPDRLRFMLADSGVRHVVTQPDFVALLPERSELEVLLFGPQLDEPAGDEPVGDEPAGDDGPASQRAFPACGPSRLAYVLYTSGSTGRPKGVAVTHGALANQMAWIADAFPLQPDDVVLHKTPFGFDAAIWEILAPLMQGALLVVAPPGLERDVPALVATLRREQVTTVQVVSSLLRVLVDEAGFAACGGLRRVFCGGEALTADLVARFTAVVPAALINLYGPTETTIQVCADQVCADAVTAGDGGPSLGRPIDNVRIHVVDDALREVPIGVRGEILIGGAAPARGYLNLPEMTAERFIADPFSGVPDAVLYRSGDLGAWRADGRLDFFGRSDHQVKLRGYRIELGEIEAGVAAHPAVALCAVLAEADANGIGQLVCAYSCRPDAAVDAGGLRAWLSVRLPDYMVPGRFVRLAALPLTASGKIDRTALAGLRPDEPAGDPHAPRDTVELRLERVWESLLDVRPVGVDRTFFELGGHSLLAVRLMAEVRREFGVDLPLVSLFQAPTVAGQAALIRTSGVSDPVLVPINPGLEGERPVFLVHPTGGTVLCYRGLVRRLGSSRPVFALQDPGLEGVAAYDSVEELAALYVARIRTAASGPYCLAGWSSGGIIAYEMARQLVAGGEEVGMLAMIDSVPPDGDPDADRPDGVLIHSIGRLIAHASALPPPDFRSLERAEGLARLHELAVTAGLLPAGAGAEWIERFFAVFRRNVDVVQRYRPGPYHRRVLLLTASEPVPEAVRGAAMQTSGDAGGPGWERFCRTVTTAIPAHHLSIVEEPAVALVGAAIRNALADVDRVHALGDRVLFSLLGH